MVLQTPLWGYLEQSSIFGNTVKRNYMTCTNGTQRLYVIGLSNFSVQGYSLNVSQGNYCQFIAKDIYNNVLQNVTFTSQRFDNSIQQFATVEQGISDVTGSVVMFFQPTALYEITMQLNGYLINSFTFTTICTGPITVQLGSNSSVVYPMPGFENVLNDVSWAILPNNVTYAQPDINISYQVTSMNSTIQYFGWTISKQYNGSLATVASANVTGSPSGGYLNYTTNGSGLYTVTAWWKSSLANQTYYPAPVSYTLGNITGLSAAGQIISGGGIISPWGYYLIIVVLAMLAGAFVAQYTLDGAGLVGLCVLWVGSILWPVSLGIAGLDMITTITATILTTMMVIAALILKAYL